MKRCRVTISEPPRFRRYGREVRAAMLIEAGLACLAEGGIAAFTVDGICRRAGTSRGLIAHHFGSKDQLLAEVYEAAYAPMLAAIAPRPDGTPLSLPELIARIFAAERSTPQALNVWMALWGAMAGNPGLKDAHRRKYGEYRATVAAAIAIHRGTAEKADELAASVIGLVDGLWLEHCIDPDGLPPAAARAACLRMLDPLLGPVG